MHVGLDKNITVHSSVIVADDILMLSSGTLSLDDGVNVSVGYPFNWG
jgi:hypothetical protein